MSKSYYVLIGFLAIAATLVAVGAYFKTSVKTKPVATPPVVMPVVTQEPPLKSATESGIATPSGVASQSGRMASDAGTTRKLY